MMLARAFLLAVLGAPRGTLALPTPTDVAREAVEAVLSTGCAQELTTAFAALPAACGVDEAGGDESGGWEARAAACLVGHECSTVCAVAVQVLRPAVGLLRGLGVAVAAYDDRLHEQQPAASAARNHHAPASGARNTTRRPAGAGAKSRKARRLQGKGPAPPPAPFAGSNIVPANSRQWLISQMPDGMTASAEPCFDSAVHDTSTPAAFHAQCDRHPHTVTVARNGFGVFGGYAERSWSMEVCLANGGDDDDSGCSCCWDRTASGDFLFKLEPGPSERFDPTGADTQYQRADPTYWPGWGRGDLFMGYDNGQPGRYGKCNQGSTYTGSSNQICGSSSGPSNLWGATEREVWPVVDTPPPPPPVRTDGFQLVELGGGAAAFCSRAPQCPQFSAEDAASAGALVLSGCLSDGNLGDTCTLTCEEGYQEVTQATSGTCTLSADGATASYVGQAVSCEPETLPDGSFAAAYCSVEAPEIIGTCCDGAADACDATSNLPTSCNVQCAEAWLPLWEHCESSLGQFNAVTALCEVAAEEFLSAAPSTIAISGLRCHPFANGIYVLDEQTIGAKRAWHASGDGQEAHLFWSDSPDRWRLGSDTQSESFAEIVSYGDLPPWQETTWREAGCDTGGEDSRVTLDPGYTTDDCETALQLVQEEVHARCCMDEGECIDGAPPSRCEYDCAHIWWEYSQDCEDYLGSAFPGVFTEFTARCDRTHARMLVTSAQGTVQSGGPAWTTSFAAERNVEYKVEMVPDDTDALRRSEVQVIAPHSHHVMASRFDSSTRGAGRKMLQWAATQDEAGVEVSVEALEGAGEFNLEVTIVGTIEHLAPEAITFHGGQQHDVSIAIGCQWDDDCTYRYNGEELRGSGSRFELRLHAVAGLTYSFSTELMAGAGTHISVGIYHENALGGSESSEAIQDNDFALGQWTVTPPGAQTYAQYYQCTPSEDDPDRLTHVPCGGDEQLCHDDLRCQDVGDFRTHPSGTFDSSHSFDWPCAATGTYFIEVTANCDVPFYSDVTRCNQQLDGEWQCPNAADSQCSSETRLTIDVVDESTTISEQTTLPVAPGMLIPGSEAQAQLASMFALSQHPAIAYVTEILPVGRGDCSMPHCQNGGDCVDMPLSTVDGVPNSPTYRCDCTPSWVGLDCTETFEEQAQLGALFDVNGGANPITPIGGGHRRTQGAEPEPEPEPEPPLAAIKTHCRGQTPGLARDHCQNVHDRIDMMGPGATTSDGSPIWTHPAGGSGKESPLASLSYDQLLACVQRQLSVPDCVQGAHRRMQDTKLSSPKGASQDHSTQRRRAQGSQAPPPSPQVALENVALYNDDGEDKICSINQCEPNPCQNGVCTPSNLLTTGAGAAAAFVCDCATGMSGLTCETGTWASPPPAPFAGSNIVDVEAATWLAGELPDGLFIGTEPCYDSAIHDVSSPTTFHALCDVEPRTIVVASNSLGHVFGAYASVSWRMEECCAANPPDCGGAGGAGSGHCWDNTATSNFLFGIVPGPPARYDTTGMDDDYQYVAFDWWPRWGYGSDTGGATAHGDLNMGGMDALGSTGRCNQGESYAGIPNQICGGDAALGQSPYGRTLGGLSWGETHMEVWPVVDASRRGAIPPPPPPPSRIYYVGGNRFMDDPASAVVYDPATNSHTDLPSMSTAREELDMGRLGGLVCAVGGKDYPTVLDSCECLDTANPGGGWSAMPSMGTARYGFAVASTGGTMCAIGGWDGSNAPYRLASVECLGHGAAAWVWVASLITARWQHGAAAVGNVIFVVGGLDDGSKLLSSVQALDLSVDGGRWEEKAPMPTARQGLAVASSGTKLFAVGGTIVGSIPLHTLEVYESATDSWSTAAPMPTARGSLAAAIVGNTLFALGGESPVTDVVEAYDIEGGSWSTAEPMATPRYFLGAVGGP
eukprot:COSAG06_NODE_306_length_17801_cov_6.989210_12_plen_1895_part_00